MTTTKTTKGVIADPLHAFFPKLYPNDKDAPVRARVWLPRYGADLMLAVVWKGHGGRPENARSLGHRDPVLAEEAAWALVAGLSSVVEKPKTPKTLSALVRAYLDSAYHASLDARERKRKQARLERMVEFFGAKRPVLSLDEEAIRSYETSRLFGLIEGRPKCGQQAIYNDFSSLRSVLLWAIRTKDEFGERLLPSNPLIGVRVSMEQNPKQPMMYHDDFETLRRKVRGRVPLHVRVFLRVIEPLGRRKESVAALLWGDIDFTRRSVLWRWEEDKMDHESEVALPYAVWRVLRWWRGRNPEARYVFSGPNGGKFSEGAVDKWLRMIYREAGLAHPRGLGWHAFRRKWNTERKDLPDVDVMEAGGWRSHAAFMRYRKADAETTRKVMEAPSKRLRRTPDGQKSKTLLKRTLKPGDL